MGIKTTKEIEQIDRLRVALRLDPPCSCLELDANHRNHYLLGYCQGLFNVENSSPSAHTEKVVKYLSEVKAAMPDSHELFINLKPEGMSTADYLKQATLPLRKNGRVPIIITHYDPKKDIAAIREIIDTKPQMKNTDTMLVRIQLNSKESIPATAKLLKDLYAESLQSKNLPDYWPLIQANDFSVEDWQSLKQEVGQELWPYTIVATTPFMSQKVLESVIDNIAVIQFFVGAAGSINEKGDVLVPSQSCVGAAGEIKKYNLFDYVETLKKTVGMNAIVGIICGQSQGWSQKENVTRVGEYMRQLEKAASILWGKKVGEKIVSYYQRRTVSV